MNRLLPITPDLAHVPNALPVFTMRADRPLPYRWWTRLSDHLAGRRDRVNSEASLATNNAVAESPWLHRLLAECATAIARGRTRTEALVAVLDRELAHLHAGVQQHEDTLETVARQINDLLDQPITDEIVGAGERYSDPDERLRRHQLNRASELNRLRQQAEAARNAKRRLMREIGTLQQERRSHWVVLQERSRQLVELYQRRACSYVRGMERRRQGIVLTAPTVSAPVWSVADLGTGGLEQTPDANLFRLTHSV